MPTPIAVVDAFTDRPFAGNPAAVCVLPAPAPEGWMRQVAREMNLSETAFLHRSPEGFALRWFTPTVEVDLCGHATLASAHLLWQDGHLGPDEPAKFMTRSGLLSATRKGNRILMDFPAVPAEPCEPPAVLLQALGSPRTVWSGRNRFDYLLELENEATVRELAPDFPALAGLGVRGVMVTSRASEGQPYDFVSRFFAPGSGINEDPVTGSAHCALGPYWGTKLGRDALTGYQASERGGTVQVQIRGERVLLGGEAVTVLRGTLV
ncbi:MAG TPA: PhzF family phenazine biosynthesis protein [Gemmatimonadales bacterium]|nr:PhzF family phenazine biosynthesis protein [Gemmatimonadales bacterium]